MKFLKIILSLVVAFAAFIGVSPVKADQIHDAKVVLGNTQESHPGTSYQFVFKHTSSNTIAKITFEFCKVASGGVTCPQYVTTGNFATADLNSVNATLGVIGDWTDTVSGATLTMVTSKPITMTGNDAIDLSYASITNTTLAEACDTTPGTDTCYIWIKTYGTNETTVIDTGVVTYTIVDAVTVTAKVDPTFTFVVAGVAANQVNNGITTSVLTDASHLPFGSLQAGTPKYAAHSLAVTTNTQSGYSVTALMNQQMTGIYTDNNIDPFVHAWGSPAAWTEPTGGAPNVNTGWLGANTTDTDITQWNVAPSGKFGAIGNVAAMVSYKTNSDNGLTPVYVTYALEANVYQPSDAYTGLLTYNALPLY